ncbi:MAG: T9SS type A sorting domain-containing protein [Candidatus Cloacimonadales bacterium]|nr:T9SS type A sorting domain-containing protein [Candidatus Cloacimonadales bacterium]
MKRYTLLMLILLGCLILPAQIPELSIWNNIRNSSYTAEDSIHIRCETIELPNIQTELFYFDGSQWQSTPMNYYQGLTYEGVIPALYGGAQSCRFRAEIDTLVAMMPALISNDVFPPQAAEMSLVASDSIGDNLDPSHQNLDITANYFGYSNSKFYGGLNSDSGIFPLNGGGIFPTTYFFYITLIINPENVLNDSVAYAMVYGNIPLFLPQGLYRVNGTEISLETLVQIGDIEAQVVSDQLIMACNFETLTNDEFFGDWPNLSNSLIVEMATAVYTLPDVFLLTDYSKFSLQVIDQYVIEPFTNVLPEISNEVHVIGAENTIVTFDYFDENGHFPLVAELIVNSEIYDFLPLGFDYSQPVIFETTFPITNWDEAMISVSDNGYEFVEYPFQSGVGVEDDLIASDLQLSIYPNPFNPSTTINFETTNLHEFARIEIYNLKGQKIKTFPVILSGVEGSIVWNGTDENNHPVSSGIYFAKLKSGDFQQTRKMLLMK